jgi:hypothetical protein
MDWLCPPRVNPKDDQEVRRELYTKDTGSWIFRNEIYRDWVTKDEGFLWLQGEGTSHSL